uniref:uncharacterized protein LOC122606515 n=1 Tax=Erigeron canadensis TaxID=72917 RepID=UPI001CB95443|nr:uncharacterized protein LOC122606515 [Erigeron canadensis]
MSKEVQQVSLDLNMRNVDQVPQFPSKSEEIIKKSNDGQKVLSLSEMSRKKHLMLSAREALYNLSDLTRYKSTPSAESRLEEIQYMGVTLCSSSQKNVKDFIVLWKYKIYSTEETKRLKLFTLKPQAHGMYMILLLRFQNKEKMDGWSLMCGKPTLIKHLRMIFFG